MKKTLLSIFLLMALTAFAQQQTVSYSINPQTFEDTASITISIAGTSVNEGTWGVTGNALYLWSWSYDVNDVNQMDSPSNGSWTSSNEDSRFAYNAGTDTYTKTFTPSVYFDRNGIGRIGFLVKAKDGSGAKQSQDIVVEVGSFQVTLTSPTENSTSIISSGASFNIAATNTGGASSYTLKANGTTINTNASTSSYSYTHTNITENQNYELIATQGATTISKKFAVVINPNTVSEVMPTGLVDGINYNPADFTKATLVLDAPLKDFVYVAGNFNNWQPTSAYAMKKDPSSGKFWLEITGLCG